MPKYNVKLSVVMYPRYESRTIIIDAKNSDEAEAVACVKVRESDDDIDYVNSVRSVKLDD